jgi:hypothetical protein
MLVWQILSMPSLFLFLAALCLLYPLHATVVAGSLILLTRWSRRR